MSGESNPASLAIRSLARPLGIGYASFAVLTFFGGVAVHQDVLTEGTGALLILLAIIEGLFAVWALTSPQRKAVIVGGFGFVILGSLNVGTGLLFFIVPRISILVLLALTAGVIQLSLAVRALSRLKRIPNSGVPG